MKRVRRSDDDGAAAVEFALLLPILLVVLCGIVDFGLVFNAKMTLTHATREGVRVLALQQDVDDAADRTREAAVGLREPETRLTVETPVACVVGDEANPATVTAHYDYTYVTPLSELMALLPGDDTGLDNPVRLSARGVMRCGG
jgi:Flp pilus assembly protein TadG